MKSLKGYIIAVGLLLMLLPAKATHLVGGEFEIKQLPTGSHDIFLNVYFDAVSGDPGAEEQEIVVSTFRKSDNAIIESFLVKRFASAMVPYTDPACQRGDLQTKLIRYKANRILSPALYGHPDGYYLVWERCCRNNGINNIRNPDAAGMVYYLEFPPVIFNNQPFVNSSPVLGAAPADYLCANELFTFDINAQDADGDSLIYFLSTPLNGHTSRTNPSLSGLPAPYQPITWETGYNVNQAILGNPNLQVDRQTGRLTVRPRFAGLFVFSITCEEYRDGRKIGEVRREIQVRVLNCPTNASPMVTVTKPDGNLYLPGDTLIVTDATDYCFDIEFTDPDLGQTLTLEAKPVNFTATPILSVTSTVVTNAGVKTKSRICWPDCAINSPDKIFLIDLIVKDNGCSSVKADTIRLQFKVTPKPNDPPVLTTDLATNTATVVVGTTLKFKLFGSDVDNDGLELSFFGTGFAPEGVGMQIAPVSGTGNLESEFTWSPTCSDFLRKEYKVNFVLKDKSCFAHHTDTVQVKLLVDQPASETEQFLPANIFTPNNDKFNDEFRMPSLPIDNCDDQFQEFVVFNRWGGKVFETTDRNFAWTGADISDGVYFYLVRFKNITYKGTVTIVR